MITLPPSLKQIAFFLERLPGIGEKTANRLALFFLKLPEKDLKEFAQNVASLKQKTKLCPICCNLTENDTCSICQDKNRNQQTIMVVETVLDLIAFESGKIYNGLYHVLHGKIDPLNRVGPEDLKIDELLLRTKKNTNLKEIIIATNTDMEGEATAQYLKEKLQHLKNQNNLNFKISRLAYGLPFGANLEYADYMTLKKAIENRLSL
jgi:recombination protein RecR